MPAEEIVPGLVRWTARHPDWNPQAAPGSSGDWEENVGSVLYEMPHAVALIDPLIPPGDRTEFLAWLDARIGGRPVSVLTTVEWHRRDGEELAERHRSSSAETSDAVPEGIEPLSIEGTAETIYWLPAVGALVPGDLLIGADGAGVRVCPESWLADVGFGRLELVELLRPLLELPVERVLVSHGEPVLSEGRAALARAIAEVDKDRRGSAGADERGDGQRS